jgi:LacI family transcriptional regulator
VLKRSPTITDIAIHVGVSSTTVSAVLGRKPAGNVRVSDAMRTRIMEAAQQMGYRPNELARALRSRKTNVIGVYTSHGYLNPYVALTSQIIGGLHLGCDEQGKDLLLHSMYRGRSPEEVQTELEDGWIDGLILYTQPHDPLAARLATSTLPVVAIIDALPGLPSVVADDGAGARRVAAHLAQKGLRRVLYRGTCFELESARRRQAAFTAAAAELGIEILFDRTEHETWSAEALRRLEALRRGTSGREKIDAVICWNDNTAYHLLEYCRQTGLRVPEDLAVVGFDGTTPPGPTPWRLTTVRAPWVEVAHTAVTLLVRLLAGETLPAETMLPVEFIPGDTT